MEFTFGFREVFMIIGFVFSFAGGYFTLKFQTKNNKEKNETAALSIKELKEFVYKELKEMEEEMKKIHLHLKELLRIDDAEEKYIPRKEHKLGMEKLEQKIDLILEAVKGK